MITGVDAQEALITAKRGATGEYVAVSTVGAETAKAFVPRPLPPDPPLAVDSGIRDRLDGALLALGRLDSVGTLLPDTHLFLYTYVRKEAVLSSQIEGAQSAVIAHDSLDAVRVGR